MAAGICALVTAGAFEGFSLPSEFLLLIAIVAIINFVLAFIRVFRRF